MKGLEAYTEKNNEKINTLINHNADKKYLKGYVNHLKLNRSEQTAYNYARHIIDFMNYCNNKSLGDLAYDDYICYENEFIDMTPSYRIVKHSALKAFSEYLYLTKQNAVYVLENAKAPKGTTKIETIEKRENNYLAPPEIKQLITAVNNGAGTSRARKRQRSWQTRDMAIIMILLNTGMRCSALYKLDVSDIDFETKRFTVKEKGKNRSYILNDTALNAIKEWLVDREKILNGEQEDALFISNRCTRLSVDSISDVTVKYGANVKDIHLTPHKLRATFGTNLYAMTGDVRAVKDAMGHSNISTTEVYIRGQEEKSKQKAALAMQELCEQII